MTGRVAAVVLAAGQGKRMNSKLPKVVHRVCGRPLVSHVEKAVREAGITEVVVVINPPGEEIKEIFGDNVEYAYQEQRLGTGHAVMMAESVLSSDIDTVVVLAGDTPLITGRLVADLVHTHAGKKAAVTVVTTNVEEPHGYGRIVRDQGGNLEAIVEEVDATARQREIKEINAGVYAFSTELLFQALKGLKPNNAQGEYYLTDVLALFRQQGLPVATQEAPAEEVLGVNNRLQLSQIEGLMGDSILERLMADGVTIVDPNSTFIEAGVQIGRDTIVHPFTIIGGQTVVGEDCELGPGAQITDSHLGVGVKVQNSVLVGCHLDSGVRVGPYAYLRPGAVLAQGAKAGTFVEIKKSIVGKNSKVPHLTYVGDTTLGEGVNVGAGTITCNYDGWHKHETFIDDGAFIGSNTNLVAPVRIGKQAVTGAGSTITEDVPDFALAVERSEQKNILEWMKKKLQKLGIKEKSGTGK